MSANTYQQCRLFIGDKEYSQFDSVNIKFPGKSKINTCSFTLNDSEFQEGKFLNKEVRVFLNYGQKIQFLHLEDIYASLILMIKV